MNKKFWDTFVCPRALLEKLNNRARNNLHANTGQIVRSGLDIFTSHLMLILDCLMFHSKQVAYASLHETQRNQTQCYLKEWYFELRNGTM